MPLATRTSSVSIGGGEFNVALAAPSWSCREKNVVTETR
jgi:hypothetical protein